MGNENSGHLAFFRRWLAGETVNNAVGIKIVGGPFNGRTKIVQLDQAGLPPAGFRGRPGRAPGPWNPDIKHTYLAVRAPDTSAGWIYEHTKAHTTMEE
ncbi:hypothetical protein H9Y04_44300 [Streptomyces sp. TRM66268-LWL]|uniref:Uncharacterized protein n=1 Tax=Streptomyces polyasparticus TaxID=2767826 RepID=A0ABR7SVK0_9ACTN|nr:hypothetical protein [Streptomyces polyasparticus]MBC9719539.1 hypothetical protein [Streptomyces polyasparticus]